MNQVMGMQEMILIVLVMLSGGILLGMAKLFFLGLACFWPRCR
jgi:hypothetical protein